jgi:hypothetical protein
MNPGPGLGKMHPDYERVNALEQERMRKQKVAKEKKTILH